MTAWAQTARDLLQLLFPRVCLGCETVEGLDADGLCEPCRAELDGSFGQNHCGRCAATIGAYGAADGACAKCRGWWWPLAGVARLGPHDGRLRDMLLAAKYGGRDDLLAPLVGHLAAKLARTDWFDRVEALTAVPTCWHRRLRGRPYLATGLAGELARTTGRRNLPLLRRVRGGPSQIGLSRSRRVANVRGAFQTARGVQMEKSVVCVVDDVTTSGATLVECARMLKRAGAAEVFAAVMCKAEPG
ncbi:MAG: ComF family protein [bacterium]|nr:ComF family protein [bacterium]